MDNLSGQFSQIYDRCIDKIYRFVYLKVNSQEIAEDLTSKVFTKGWESYKTQSKEIKNPEAFLYQIARNAVIDHYRQKDRTKVISSELSPEIVDRGKNAQETAIFNADLEAVKGAILKLKKEYQDVLIWHYLEDLPIGEIAKLAGRPEGTVRVMLHRGLKDLKDLVQDS